MEKKLIDNALNFIIRHFLEYLNENNLIDNLNNDRDLPDVHDLDSSDRYLFEGYFKRKCLRGWYKLTESEKTVFFERIEWESTIRIIEKENRRVILNLTEGYNNNFLFGKIENCKVLYSYSIENDQFTFELLEQNFNKLYRIDRY